MSNTIQFCNIASELRLLVLDYVLSNVILYLGKLHHLPVRFIKITLPQNIFINNTHLEVCINIIIKSMLSQIFISQMEYFII